MLTFDEKWMKVLACDATYDGLFYTAVKTTGIYCRPSCRSRKPKKENVDFYVTREEAETNGFRPCKRCQPEVEHAQLSPFHLERTFTQVTGETPRQLLERIRIDKAAYLLRTTHMSNLTICYEVGFQTPSNFYRVFRQVKGCTPNTYRKGEDL